MNPTEAIESLQLSIKSTFIPFSQSRNKREKYPSLNWSVTLEKNGKPVLTTDYMAGCAHVPGYKQMDRSIAHAEMIRQACETGYSYPKWSIHTLNLWVKGPKIEPKAVDVIYSLVMDSDVLNYSSFEDWASNFGYDADSRSAEKTYRACLEIALAFRAAVGESGLTMLAEAFQDY